MWYVHIVQLGEPMSGKACYVLTRNGDMAKQWNKSVAYFHTLDSETKISDLGPNRY